MKLKNFLAIALVASSATTVFAQYEGTAVYDRIGHGNDSIEALSNLSLFGDYYKNKNWSEAYTPWKWLIEHAPISQASIYTRGQTMLEQLTYNSPEKADKQKYLKELLDMYDIRNKYVNELNSFSSALMQTSKGTNICRKAYFYANYGPTVLDDYSLENAYGMFTEGINLVNDDPSREVEGFVLYKYFDVSYQKYRKDPANFREQFIKDYMLCKEVCEKMLEKANQASDSVAAQKIVAQYDPVLVNVEDNFGKSRAAAREDLIAIFTPKVEAKKDDFNYLQSVIDILAANDCDDTEVYYTASRYAYEIKPTYNSAIGTAQWYTNQNNHAESVKYYDKAIELCTNDRLKSRIAMRVVYALAKSGQGDNVESYLQKVSQFDPTMSGKANLFRAQNAAASKNYDKALAYASQAASEDPSISGTAQRLKERIVEAQRKASEYAKANAEYKAQLEKQQKLENFWKGH